MSGFTEKNSGKGYIMIRLCVAGATGRMGSAIIREAVIRGYEIVGAVESPDNVNLGKNLRDLGLCDSDVNLVGSAKLGEALRDSDVYVTFTRPEAEITNLPVVVKMKKRIVLGTTGFTNDQTRMIHYIVSGKVPAVFSPNFTLGVNVLFKLAQVVELFPQDYDISISEIHHTGKKDAPSGTAKKLSEIIMDLKDYRNIVYGRNGVSPRESKELEISSLRIGGVPGIHNLAVAGPYEMIRIEHISFSRRAFAQGALYAVEWIYNQKKPKIYDMSAVLREKS